MAREVRVVAEVPPISEDDIDLLSERFCFIAGSSVSRLFFSGEDSVRTCLLFFATSVPYAGFASILTL